MTLKSLFLGLSILSAVVAVPSGAFAATVYQSPRLQGLEVDRCITSENYTEGCSQQATEHAATMFCRQYGLSHATRWSWQDQSTDNQRSVQKLVESRGVSLFQVQKGSYIFTEITCEGWR
ncbi:MAG: hypothetical protein AAFY72_05195 [Cyanobacteria bacterium J06649_4]